jgi:isopentenyl phosphate kinase
VVETFLQNNINCISFPPSSIFKSDNGRATHAYLEPLIASLNAGITPILYGDVIFDDSRGGTILSTEDIFFYLTKYFNVQQILLSGIEPAIFSDFPQNNNPISKITLQNFSALEQKIGHSASPDVTGGMIEKVRLMMDLIKTHPHLKINIFSASIPGNMEKILRNEAIGTTLIRE